MKSFKFNLYLLLLPLALLMLSCEDDNDGSSDLEVIKTTINTTPGELTGEIELSNPNFDFVLNGGDWCEAVKDGNKIILNAGTNYEFDNRTVEVIISSGHTKYRIPVTQTGVVFELLDDRVTQYNYSLHGDERVLDLLTNVEYEVIIPETDKSWISVEKIGDAANSLKIKVEGSEKLRNSTITFKYMEKTINFKINQFDYLSYNDLLGPAKMLYTNSKGERIEANIEFIENVHGSTFTINGIKANVAGVERDVKLGVTYIDDVTTTGELRFYANYRAEEFFTDPDYPTAKKLGVGMCHTRALKATGVVEPELSYGFGNKYYPAIFEATENGNIYTFRHSEKGNPSAYFHTYETKGLAISALTSTNSKPSNSVPYELLLDVVIIKD